MKVCKAVCVLALLMGAVAIAHAQEEFNGFYVGASIGPTFSKGDYRTTTVLAAAPPNYFASSSIPAIASAGAMKLESKGFNLAFDAGYNWNADHLLVGFEVDMGELYMRDFNVNGAFYPCCPATQFQIRPALDTDWMFTARPRFGYTSNNWLIYGTGGIALAGTSADTLFTDTFATAHESASLDTARLGWTAGGGLEYKFAHRWGVKAEYLFADFGTATYTSNNLTAFTPPIAFPGNVFTHSYDLQANIVRFGVNFYFHK